MSAFATARRRAVGFVPYGSPVASSGKGVAATEDLDAMIGVARRGGADPRGWSDGEQVTFQTDGGVKTILNADATIALDGVPSRCLASESHYFELREGKIVA